MFDRAEKVESHQHRRRNRESAFSPHNIEVAGLKVSSVIFSPQYFFSEFLAGHAA